MTENQQPQIITKTSQPSSDFYNPETGPYYSVKDHKVCLITGGNSGIGWYTVLHLYLHGYIVYIAGRNKNKIATAIKDIKTEAIKRREIFLDGQTDEGKTKLLETSTLGDLKYIHLDLLNLSSVEKAASQFRQDEEKLDLLIDNAGIMALPHEITADGFEIQIQANYVAHVLLDELLLDMLEKSADPRLIFLSSIGHNFCYRRFAPDSTLNNTPNMLYTWVRYGMAKTFGIQYMRILAKKYPKILCTSIHPGFVFDTHLFDYWAQLPVIGRFYKKTFGVLANIGGISNEDGSKATLKAALSPDFTAEKDNGNFLYPGGEKHQPSRIALDENYADQTYSWAISELKKRGFNVGELGHMAN